MSVPQRARAARRPRSEIAAEGLDFEFVNVMVNYDLPWNPDARRAAHRPPRSLRAAAPRSSTSSTSPSRDTIEERILERLCTTHRIFESAIGDLESILGRRDRALTRELLQPGLTPRRGGRHHRSGRREHRSRAKTRSERFEQESQALLGQDDVFTEQLERIEHGPALSSGRTRFANFVTVALKARFRESRSTRGDGLHGDRCPDRRRAA